MQSPGDEFFQDLDYYLSKLVIATRLFNKARKVHGRLSFPAPPEDYQSLSRTFKPWQKSASGNYFQGQVGTNDQMDGKGIMLVPMSHMVIGHYKNGRSHGQFIQLDKDGEKWTGDCKDGAKDGRIVRTTKDGSESVFIYSKGKKIGKEGCTIF